MKPACLASLARLRTSRRPASSLPRLAHTRRRFLDSRRPCYRRGNQDVGYAGFAAVMRVYAAYAACYACRITHCIISHNEPNGQSSMALRMASVRMKETAGGAYKFGPAMAELLTNLDFVVW